MSQTIHWSITTNSQHLNFKYYISSGRASLIREGCEEGFLVPLEQWTERPKDLKTNKDPQIMNTITYSLSESLAAISWRRILKGYEGQVAPGVSHSMRVVSEVFDSLSREGRDVVQSYGHSELPWAWASWCQSVGVCYPENHNLQRLQRPVCEVLPSRWDV